MNVWVGTCIGHCAKMISMTFCSWIRLRTHDWWGWVMTQNWERKKKKNKEKPPNYSGVHRKIPNENLIRADSLRRHEHDWEPTIKLIRPHKTWKLFSLSHRSVWNSITKLSSDTLFFRLHIHVNPAWSVPYCKSLAIVILLRRIVCVWYVCGILLTPHIDYIRVHFGYSSISHLS